MTDEDLLKLTQKAYACYYETTNGKDVLGRDLPVWQALPEVLQSAWQNAIYYALHHVSIEASLADGRVTSRAQGI